MAPEFEMKQMFIGCNGNRSQPGNWLVFPAKPPDFLYRSKASFVGKSGKPCLSPSLRCAALGCERLRLLLDTTIRDAYR